MIASLLIANRGEIARRIIRTARPMGVRTVAVYSDADAESPFAREADLAVRIGPPPAAESYLKIDAILDAAEKSGAEAIHPGYGFLAENAEFAEACVNAGLIFVGPPAAAIRAMGRKDLAKAAMAEAGVPVTPGYHGEDQSDATFKTAADEIGYPVLVKAAAGGGGKGMRAVAAPGELADALASARREAAAAFGDDRLILEQLIASPRHVEVQVFGDAHGNVIHLFERDCSLQRRHQKVIEEAPAPGMTEQTRAAMCAAAVAAARRVGYQNAGTVEFIADGRKGLKPDRFWFMEMNTRLQVEHAVTEMVTGLDLVELQLRVASGESLPPQDAITLSGHAIEARLYAEDPASGFLPSIGPLAVFDLPAFSAPSADDEADPLLASPLQGEDAKVGGFARPPPERGRSGGGPALLRLDSGVEEGDAVRPYYDPMLAKAIAHAPTREQAAAALAGALATARIWPVRTNAGFLTRALADEDFRAGRIDTGFISARAVLCAPPPPQDVAAFGAVVEALRVMLARADAVDPWRLGDGWRLNAPSSSSSAFVVDGTRIDATATRRGLFSLNVAIGERVRDVAIAALDATADSGALELTLDGVGRQVGYAVVSQTVVLFVAGEAFELAPPQPGAGAAALEAGDAIVAPMPGRVLALRAKAGDALAAGQVVLVLEAMKMEHALAAPRAGVLAAVNVQAGEQVAHGDLLARLEPLDVDS